ncbi:MAG: N-acetylmuramoyl-L-alanine amidase [Pseudomonadota bacterium]
MLSYGEHQGRVRLSFDVSPAPAYAAFTLAEPDRIVLDFPALRWAVEPEPDFGPIPYISSIRHGLFRRDRARMILALSEPVSIDRIFTEKARPDRPGRLVIDLSPAGRAAFDARAGTPERARWRDYDAATRVPAEADDIIVAIDPGHGGIDPGAVAGAMIEKNIVLDFARKLAGVIDARDGFRAAMIRDDDSFVPLSERVARAKRAGAHLLISIHADTVAEGTASGMSAYTLSDEGSDEAAVALAERENRADIIAGADLGGETDNLTRLLVELAQRGTQAESIKLASAVIRKISDKVAVLRSRPLRRAAFRVLKSPDMPSILLELGFLNSKRDQKRLADPEWVAMATGAVADGIAAWRATASPGFTRRR